MMKKLQRFFSALLVICMLISMVPADVLHHHAHAATSSTLFLKPNSEWLVDGARFAAYFFGNGEKWVSMTGPDSNGYYKVSAPSGYGYVIFCRMNGGTTDNTWDNKWNQTADLTIPTSGECCWTLNSGDWGGGGAWSHKWNSGSVTKAATCTAAGTKTYTCSLCSGTKTESIAATGHSYTSKVTAPTCTAQGYTTWTCSKCSNSYKDTYKNATGHSYTSTVTKAATCTAAGTKKYTCSKCSNSYTETITKLGHNYTSKVTAPTCTAQGYTTWTCSRCSNSYKDTYTNATGHSYSTSGSCTKCGAGCSHSYTSSVTKAATCTTAGTRKYTCSTCKYSYTESIAATGHSYTSKVTAPTCTAQGYTTYTCSTCSYSYTGNTTSATGHSYTSKVTTAATCTTAGVRTYTCSKCSDSYTESIAATGHSYTSKVTAPTCTAGGYTTHTCSSCGNSYKDTETAATGHSYSGATCSSCGTTRSYYLFGYINGANYACEEDAANIGTYKFTNNTLTVKFTSDSYVAVKTGDNLSWYMTNGYPGDGVASATLYNTNKGIDANKLYVPGGTEVKFTLTVNTDETLKLSYVITSCTHDYTSSVTKVATCTSDGVRTYTCSKCANSYTEAIAATGHSYSGATCSTCGNTRTYYLFGFINGANYACEEDSANIGSYKFTNNTLTVTFTSDSYVAVKTGDNLSWYMTDGYPGDGVTSATLYNTSKGIDANKLYVPGGTQVKFTLTVNTNETLKLSYTILSCKHSYTSEVTKAATCTATGTRKYTCSICGNSYTETIAALGHSYSSKVTKPTCTTGGYTTYTCSTCGDSYTGNETAATGHSYSGATCTTCGNTRTYYLFGYINGANYGCEEDDQTIGIYKFTNGILTATFDCDSYVAVKTGDNLSWYMTDGYPGDDATSATLYNTNSGIEVNKLRIPGGCTVKLTLTVNKDETLKLSYTITSCPHNYSTEVTKEPTCTATGSKKHTCSICGDSYTETVAALGHSYSSKVTAPTCTAQGYTTYTCSKCSDSYTGNTTAATGHSYSSKVTTAATCTTDGVKTYTCSKCSDSYTETIEATGHNWSGSSCTNCGQERSYYLFGFINGANYGCEEDDQTIGIYKFVGGKLTVKFQSDSYVAVKTGDNQAWYMTDGYPGDDATSAKLYNTSSGIEVNKMRIPGGAEVVLTLKVNTDDTLQLSYTITSCDHNYSSQITKEATCTENGVKTYSCSICGDSYTESIAALGHDYTSKVTKNASCTTDGVKTFTCGNCGHSYTEAIAALGHNYSGAACTLCGNVRSYYLFGYINGANYGCEEDDQTIGAYKFEGGKLTVKFQSDSYVAVKTGDNLSWYMTDGYPGDDATSAKLYNTNSGIEVNKMRIPGGAQVELTLIVNTDDTLQLSYVISSCDHNYSSEITKAATCTEAGTKTYSCSICGDSYTESIAALGHSYSSKVTKAATCTEAGTKTYTCATCAHSYTEQIPATGHSYVGDTCTSCGNVRGYYLFGFINGANYGCEEDGDNIGTYKFVGGKLVTTFESDSYVAVKTGDNLNWYMTNGYPGDDAASAVLYDTSVGIEANKLRVPGGVEVTFTLTVNSDGTLTLSYTYVSPVCDHKTHDTDGICTACGTKVDHSYSGAACTVCGAKRSYYLFGFINGANYACEEDELNIGIYKFVGGKLTVTFDCDSYVAVKTGDNLSWYMTEGYDASATSVTLHNTASGIAVPEKMFVPGGVAVTFSLSVIASDDTLILSYVVDGSTCAHASHDTNGKCTLCGTAVEHSFSNGSCTVCGKACDHDYSNGKCSVCGLVCVHGNWKDGTCADCGTVCAHSSHNSSGICTGCGANVGHSYVGGICSVCGDGCAHSWKDGTCSKCGTTCDHTWSGGSCSNCGMASTGITVHFVNTLGWSGVVAYAWEASTDTALSGYGWPGAIINRDADGYHTVVLDYVPASGKSLGLIFHNWNGGQTADLTVDYATLNETREIWVKPSTTANSEGKFDCTVATAKTGLILSPEVDGTSVTFRYQGTATKVYLAGSMNDWSATATKLTKGSDGIWSVTLDLAPGVHEYKFIVDGEWISDPSNVGSGGYDGNCTVVVPEDDTVTDTGKIKVVLHFYRASGDYAGWDVWFWCNESSGSVAFSDDPNNKGKIATYTLDGVNNTSLGYTVRKSDWSDKEFYDRYIDLTDVRSGTVHYFLNSGSASGLRVLGEDVISTAKLSYANYNYEGGNVWVKTTLPLTNWSASDFAIVDESGNATGVTVTDVSIDGNGYTLHLSRALSLTEAGSFQVKYGSFYCSISYNAHNLFYTDKFASEYTYHGDDLGATWSKTQTTFKVWAPTAKQVYVKIFDSGNWGGGNQVQYVEMKQSGSGTWAVTVTGNLSGYYYNYDVVFPTYTVEATDPYAKGVGANGDRGMIVDFDSTDPSGWDNDISPNKYMNYTDAIIYEMHIREMTIDESSGVKDEWKGKYLGLTQQGTNYNGYSTALQHLRELGITHVQLMPAFDFNSADEYHLTDWAQYAWGYDPKNFNVPEGSYSTDPFNGATRITEFKQMVQAFHQSGINVVMDVVYNHTFDGGNYCGNKIVPNYYSRFYGEGNWSNGSGVGNDFATERAMARNLIVDSIMHWVEEYHIDGFRFDLAGLIDTVTINDIVNAVHAKYPNVMFYGEGWAAGGTAVQYGYNLASQGNAWEVGGFGFFNDSFRNAIAGDNGNSWGFATGAGDKFSTIAGAFRASNGWSTTPTQTINYVSCHDNYCLMDKIQISRNGAYWDQMARMNGLSTAMVMLSQGVPFFYSGDELLREKKDAWGNRYDNAYGTNDDINKIRWSDLETKEFAQRTDDYYAGLIAFRKNHAALRCANGGDAWNATSVHSINSNTMLVYVDGYYNYECSDGIVMIFNGSDQTQWVDVQNYVPHGYYQATIHGTQAGNTPLWGKDINSSSDAVGVEPFSVTVLVKGDLVHEESVYNQNMALVNCAHSAHTTSGLCTSCGVSVSHSYSGGSCSVCGLSQSAPDTVTVYFDNSSTNWSSVKVYAWAEAAGRTTEFTASWPGTAMTDMGSGIFAMELPIEATNLIFNDGSGNQSSNLTAPAYTSDATMYDPATSAWVKYEASCKHTSHTTEGICSNCGLEVSHSYTEGVCDVCGVECDHAWASGTCYVCGLVCGHTSHDTGAKCVTCGVSVEHTYTSEGSCSNCGLACWHSWNGDTCNTCGYVCAHAEHTTSGLCTYCGSDVEHSYTDGKCGICGLAEDAPTTITIYYDNSESQWETVYVYAWTEAAGRTVLYTDIWPGTAMTLVEGDVYSITLDRNASIVIFNDGSGNQTADQSIPAYDSGLDLYRSATGIWGTYGVACEHSYEATVTEPACTEGGYTTNRCTSCGDTYTDSETEALGHSYVDGSCERCGEADPSVCQHTYEAVVTEPTCTEVGYTTYTCSACGDSYAGDETEALGHSYVDGACERCGAVDPAVCEHTYESVVTEPTCTEVGYTTNTCTICGDSNVSDETEALGHSYVDGACERCGEAEPTDETVTVYYDNSSTAWSTVRVTAETETGETITNEEMREVSKGVYAYDLPANTTSVTFSDGGSNRTNKKPMPERGSGKNMYDASSDTWTTYDATACEHTYESVVTEPTCTEGGYTTYTCSVCGDSYVGDETEALGHSYVEGKCEHCGEADYDSCEHTFETSTVSPTCDTEGYTANTCTICGYVEKSDMVEAKGHSFSNGLCTVCGKPKPLSTTYYLIGYINGANYGCEEDGGNMGIYKFEDNMLKATFESTSYVFVKTEGNVKWYMCDGYPGDGVNAANLYDTGLPIQHDKVNVPGAVEITFTLIERDDGSLTLTYVKAGACDHDYYSYTSQEPGCTTTGVKTYRCSLCANTYTTTIAAKGHNYSGAYCTNCGADSPYYSATYYLFGYINGSNYACEEDGANIGSYKFSYGRLVVTFDTVSYVAVKTSDNAKWYMTNGYPGDDATSVKLYDTSTGIDANKLRVPGGVQITFTLRENSDGSLTLSYVAAACSHTYDDGWVSTAPGCTTTGVRTYNCTKCGATKDETIAATGHNYVGGACAGCGDITADYVEEFYLFGWINGGNYGCEDDYANMGAYKFVDGLLTATFEQDSYIAIKTTGNLKWFMALSYIDKGTTTGNFYDTANGATEKMFVPGGVEISFVLTVNANGSLTLSYTTDGSCAHSYDEGTVYTEPGCTTEGSMRFTCSLCGHVKSEPIEATGHKFEGDTCNVCGYVCVHEYEQVIHPATCVDYEDYEFICSACGNCIIYHAEELADWMTAIPELMDPQLFESKTEYRFRDYETLVSMEPTMEGFTLLSSQWINATTNTIYYVTEWPSGFDTSHALYAEYDNIGSKVTASETDTDRLVIDSDEIVGYIYYHWCYDGYPYTVATKQGSYDRFHAYFSTKTPDEADKHDASDDSYRFDDSTACDDSVWYFCVPVYGQTYTTSQQEFTYERWTEWSEWSEEPVEATETREVESVTYYRLPDVKLGEHTYETESTEPTCTEEGTATHTCTFCGDTYTEPVAANGHSYESVTTDPTCTEAGSAVHTCTVCGDSYTESIPATGHSYTDGVCTGCGEKQEFDYYLFGWINGSNYACEEDSDNMGQYKFVDGKLVATFDQDSYVAVKVSGNTKWYMTNGYPGDDATSAQLFDTATGIDANKLRVPGNVQVTFTLVENTDGSLTLSYELEQSTVVQPTLTLKYPSLSFEAEILYNVYFIAENIDDVVDMGLITFDTELLDGTVENATDMIPGFITDGSIWKVGTNGISAKNLGDTLYFKVYAQLSDGSYVYTDMKNYSAVTYANTILKRSTSSSYMKALVVAMLNYGTEAQLFFGHNTDSLMNAGLTAEQQALVSAYDESMVDPVVSVDATKAKNFIYDGSSFARRAPTVSFDGAFAINYYFTAAKAPDDGMTLYYWNIDDYNAATTLTVDNATGSMEMIATGTANQFWGEVPGIAAKELDQTIFVVGVYESNGVTYTSGVLNYSIGKYCAGLAAKDTSDQQAFAQATAVYGYCAKEYFANV